MRSKFLRGIPMLIVGILVFAPFLLAACGPKATPLDKGKVIYEETAGGVGCKMCHGADGKGGNQGPPIRGKSVEDVNRALATSETMEFINLTDEEVESVAAYLKYLNSQP
ncbi:MAG: cytochrome c [Dehalococcoidia bacterium]|nr:cytochrome c [Dehalococcoidia bacterium]MDZ4245500.1 cytochrome c [Dehalococcoidia bacterium]